MMSASFLFDSVPPPYCSRSGQNGGFTALILENTSTVPSFFLLLKSYNKKTHVFPFVPHFTSMAQLSFTQDIVQCSLFFVQCTSYIVYCTMYNVQCSLFIVDFIIVHVGTVHAPIKHSPLIFCIVHSFFTIQSKNHIFFDKYFITLLFILVIP